MDIRGVSSFSISVVGLNTCFVMYRHFTAILSVLRADGYATVSPTSPGSLTVYLQGVPVGAPYTVFLLGPATYGPQSLYQYAVVSDPFQLSLFVLVRDVSDYFATYDSTVRAWLNNTGFNNILNTPILTTQTNCTYW